jgi:hypothetical protein
MNALTKLTASFLVAASLLLCARAQSQTLVYSVCYAETPASFHARYPNGAIIATAADRLATLRTCRKAEIYSVSLMDGKRKLLFSDEGIHSDQMNLEVKPAVITPDGSKAYGTGILRESRGTPSPGAGCGPEAIYEVSLDGTNRTRCLSETQENRPPPLLNPAGTEAFSGAFENGQFIVSVYDVETWKTLRKWDLSKVMQAHCPACIPQPYGWLANGHRLFFNMYAGDSDDPAGRNAIEGVYFATEEGADLGGIPAHAGEMQLPGYTRWSHFIGNAFPVLIGQAADGDYVFCDYAVKNGPLPARLPNAPDRVLVITGADFKIKRQIVLERPLAFLSSYLSRDGKYLAYTEERTLPDYSSESHLWGRDLESGTERELFVGPRTPQPKSTEPRQVYQVLGWAPHN